MSRLPFPSQPERKGERQMTTAWDPWARWRENRARLCAAAVLIWVFLMATTPTIPHSLDQHDFADMRNLIGVPNTLNVISSFPFLVVGVVGFVFCLHGSCFGISLKGELWGWASFYAGFVVLAFGSAYYHLKPDDARVIWERMPMLLSVVSLFSILVIERVNLRLGLTSLVSLLALAMFSIAYERTFDDLRLCMMLHLFPCVTIPVLLLFFPPKYTHSRYWFFAAGFFILARFEAASDRKVYRANNYFISGHSLEHLCLAMIPILLTVMLWLRNITIEREC